MIKVSEFTINLFYTENSFNNIFINMSSGCRPSTEKPRILNVLACIQAIADNTVIKVNDATYMQEHGQ